MNALTTPKYRTITISIRGALKAKNFDNPTQVISFDPTTYPNPLIAEVDRSTNNVLWLVTRLRDGRYGWPFPSLNGFIDHDLVRVDVDGEEQEDTSAL